MAYIYKITNIVNDKKYVGATIGKINCRWNIHKSQLRNKKHGNRYLQRSWDKYREKSFVFEVLEQCPESDIVNREQYYKDLLSAEYNLAPITEPFGKMNKGRKHSPETIEKIRLGNLGKKLTPQHKAILIASRLGTHHTKEAREKISNACKGKNKGKPKPPFTAEHISNMSLSHIGKQMGEHNPSFAGYYRLYHPSYGEKIMSQTEWRTQYNGSKLGKIWQICNGKRKSYKGWTCKGRQS
jgi:group I intron endonuclease